MSVRSTVEKRETERMSDRTFRGMTRMFQVIDFLFPYVGRRARKFGIREGMTVVDYGCGPGRYTTRFARLVGETGKVYAVDIHELAIEAVERKVEQLGLNNVQPVLAQGYDSAVPDNVADVVCAIDMFWIIKQPTSFLQEIKRIARPGGMMIVDDGHRRRAVTRQKILDSGLWDIVEERRDHLKCRPR
jgi:ubiquinone/menaquinone biosynthesis C-methylase UbiE